MRLSDFRALVPSWLFFDDIGSGCELWIRSGLAPDALSEWRNPLDQLPRRPWNLFHNPQGNWRLYLLSSFERLLLESQEHFADPASFVQTDIYGLCVEHLKPFVLGDTYFQFKISAALEGSAPDNRSVSEDAFVSQVHKT